MSNKAFKIFLIACGGFVLLVGSIVVIILAAQANTANRNDMLIQAATPAENASESTSEIVPYSIELSSGNYEAGVDFPAGKYDIVAVSGTGSVSSSDMEILAMLGVVDSDSLVADYYEPEYKNITLSEGVTLKVKDVVINLISSN